MKSYVVFLCVGVLVLCEGLSLAQYGPQPYYPDNGPIVNAPQNQTVLNQPQNQTVVEQRPMVPVVPGTMPPPANAAVPPNPEIWNQGWRESWTHEFRPIQEHYGYNDSRYPSSQGWYFNQNTGNYQRNVAPIQQQYYQQQYYQYPSQCQPRYYYYYQPNRCSLWPW